MTALMHATGPLKDLKTVTVKSGLAACKKELMLPRDADAKEIWLTIKLIISSH
jgi:hypothetical protein